MGHIVNHNAFRLGINQPIKFEFENKNNLFLLATINAFLLRFNIYLINFYYTLTDNNFIFFGTIFINVKHKKKKKNIKRYRIKKKIKKYKKKSVQIHIKKKYKNRFKIINTKKKKFGVKNTIFSSHLVYKNKYKYSKKKILKNMLKLFKLKLKLEQLLYNMLECPVTIKLNNVMNNMTSKEYQLKKEILKNSTWYKWRVKNIESLINIILISLFTQNIKFFIDYSAKEIGKMHKHWNFLNTVKFLMEEFKRHKFIIKGFKLSLKGKINGNERARQSSITVGNLPLSTISNNISYSCAHSYSKFGKFGIKGWMLY